MKHLFIIRHGEPGVNGNLTQTGMNQINRIVRDMKSIVGENNGTHYLLSSPAPKAEQSAQIIADGFGLKEFDRNYDIWTSRGNNLSQEELEAVDDMIIPYKDNHDILTIVSHYELVGSYPEYIAKKLFERTELIRRPDIGEGVHLDLGLKNSQMLPIL
jgi:phosphohistidine phosphatase SixA